MKEEMIKNIEKEYLEMTMPEIAKKYGVTKRVVQYWAEKFNLSKYSVLTEEEKAMVWNEYKPLKNNSELAEKLKMSQNALASVYKRLKNQHDKGRV